MALPIIEYLGWALWEFIFAFIFYNTGVLLLKIFSFGRVALPFLGVGALRTSKPPMRQQAACYALGMAFYAALVLLWMIPFSA